MIHLFAVAETNIHFYMYNSFTIVYLSVRYFEKGLCRKCLDVLRCTHKNQRFFVVVVFNLSYVWIFIKTELTQSFTEMMMMKCCLVSSDVS